MSTSPSLDPMNSEWSLQEAITMCQFIEPIISPFDAHIGLTGGCLYKGGLRKDLDIVLYPHGGSGGMKETELVEALEKAGFGMGKRFTRVQKAMWFGKSIDFIFPHHEGEPGCEIGSDEPCHLD
jgi:hypothetical protein